MAREKREEAIANRQKIAELLNKGLTYRAISEELNTSLATVAKVKKLMQDPNESIENDRRESNGREVEFDENILKIVLDARKDTMYGPRMLYAIMQREPEKFGIAPDMIPSPATIGKWIRQHGMARKLIGSGDDRAYPIDFIEDVGTIAIDGWGPYHLGSERIYIVTCQDRFSRITLGVPTATGPGKAATVSDWVHSIYLAKDHMLEGKSPNTVMCDNGIGMMVTNGHTPQAVRHALNMGARVVFIPPAMPWKNGRLERFHWTMETDYFRGLRERMKNGERISKEKAINGLAMWFNWYNTNRPHGSLKWKAPADNAWYEPVTPAEMTAPDYERLDPQKGIIDAIRLTHNNGYLELWGEDYTRISELFGGQFLRVRFFCDPNVDQQLGQIIWQGGKKQEPVVVATFNHEIDRPRKKGQPLVKDIQLVDFENEHSITPPPTRNLRTTVLTNTKPTTNATALQKRLDKPLANLQDELAYSLFDELMNLSDRLFSFWQQTPTTSRITIENALLELIRERVEQAEFRLEF